MTAENLTLKMHQNLIVSHILKFLRCGVFAQMGLGKTAATLTALDHLSYVDDTTFPALIVAPLRVARSVWSDEVKKWKELEHLRVSPVVGTLNERILALKTPAEVYTVNYEQLPWLVSYYSIAGKTWPFKTVVADESSKLKGYRTRQGTQRAKALSEVAFSKVKRFIELTGTPASNGLKDLWGQIFFLDAGERLGRSFAAFANRWFQRSYNGFGLDPLPHAQKEIQDKLKDICVSLNAKDYFDLKEPVTVIRKVKLPDSVRELYDDMEKQMFVEIEEQGIEAFNPGSKMMKCRQIASGAVYLDEDNLE